MKNFTLALGALALLAACSSEPSDFRPGKKVSVDVVYAGGRPTGIYPSDDNVNASQHGHAAHADGHGTAHGDGHAEGHAEGHGTAHGEGHVDGEMHDADASEAAATGSENQKSGVGHPATKAEAEGAAAPAHE